MAGKPTFITRSAATRTSSPRAVWGAHWCIPWVACALSGCSFIYDERPTQCSVDSDCKELQADLDLICDEGLCVEPTSTPGAENSQEPWGCLETGEKLVSTQPRVTQEIPLVNVVTRMPPANIEALVCQKFDEQCESPSERLTADQDGVIEFTVNAGFDGFLDISADGIMPSRVQFFNVTDQGRTTTPLLIPESEIDFISELSGVTYNPEKVTVIMELSDCTGKPLKHATGETDAATDDTRIVYLLNHFPSPDEVATSEDGLVALFNLEPGTITLRGVTQDGVTFASEGIVAPSGYIVYLGLRPNQ
jgi:hypothetical protein